MSTFHLFRESAKTLGKQRIILDAELPANAELIRSIEASNWIKASSAVHELEFEHVAGYGYF